MMMYLDYLLVYDGDFVGCMVWDVGILDGDNEGYSDKLIDPTVVAVIQQY